MYCGDQCTCTVIPSGRVYVYCSVWTDSLENITEDVLKECELIVNTSTCVAQ